MSDYWHGSVGAYASTTSSAHDVSYAELAALIDKVKKTRILYVECGYTEGKMYKITGTRIVIGPKLAALSIKDMCAVVDTCEVLPIDSGDINRGEKLIEYGDEVFALKPFTEPLMLSEDVKAFRIYTAKP